MTNQKENAMPIKTPYMSFQDSEPISIILFVRPNPNESWTPVVRGMLASFGRVANPPLEAWPSYWRRQGPVGRDAIADVNRRDSPRIGGGPAADVEAFMVRRPVRLSVSRHSARRTAPFFHGRPFTPSSRRTLFSAEFLRASAAVIYQFTMNRLCILVPSTWRAYPPAGRPEGLDWS